MQERALVEMAIQYPKIRLTRVAISNARLIITKAGRIILKSAIK